MVRAYTKIGDIFSVKIAEDTKKYFQYIARDLTQLNSDVIRAFKEVYSIDINPDLKDIIKGEVDFYAHCVVKWGVQSGLWERMGNVSDIGEIDQILFRDTQDEFTKNNSDKWWIWKINNEQLYVGKLEGVNTKSEIGIVISPDKIVHRMKTGSFNLVYPDYK